MALVIFKKGKSTNLAKQPLVDGQLSITTDEGRLYIDYAENGETKRKALYSGILTIGDYQYDGTKNVTIPSYDGNYDNNN